VRQRPGFAVVDAHAVELVEVGIIRMLGASCTVAAVLSPAAALAAKAPTKGAAPHILWRIAWNTNNIGDIGHVPGALALLRRHIPEARVRLWAHQDLVVRGEIACL
jgi:hypothetical protein